MKLIIRDAKVVKIIQLFLLRSRAWETLMLPVKDDLTINWQVW